MNFIDLIRGFVYAPKETIRKLHKDVDAGLREEHAKEVAKLDGKEIVEVKPNDSPA